MKRFALLLLLTSCHVADFPMESAHVKCNVDSIQTFSSGSTIAFGCDSGIAIYVKDHDIRNMHVNDVYDLTFSMHRVRSITEKPTP